jgi:uncharacterized protein (TIGR00730 family)
MGTKKEQDMFFNRIYTSIVLSWKFLRIFFQLLIGAWRVSKLSHPIISIFGSSKTEQADQYAHEANKIAALFVAEGISVLTGGGPGIMQAANCGAVLKGGGRAKITSIGINVRGLEGKNPCVQQYFELDSIFARKWLLTQYSSGFVLFPGGIGTLNELSDVLVLIQTQQLKKVPIVLIGKEYWQPFMDWLNNEMFQHRLITSEHLKLFSMTDDIQQAFCFIQGKCTID